jgi:hypothetical protein
MRAAYGGQYKKTQTVAMFGCLIVLRATIDNNRSLPLVDIQ